MGPNFVHLSTPNSAAILCRQISTDLRSRQQALVDEALQPGDDGDVAALLADQATHQVGGRTAGHPVVDADVGQSSAVGQIGGHGDDRDFLGHSLEDGIGQFVIGQYDDQAIDGLGDLL